MKAHDRKDKRILFMGTPEFAVPSLQALVEAGYTICGVVTNPDKPAGRGLKLQQSAVKKAAVEHNLPVFSPETLSDPDFLREIQSLDADLAVVVAFKKLPKSVFEAPKMGSFNLHTSYLPDYRGAAPIQRAIMQGESTTGITTFLLNEEIDAGTILYQERIQIGENMTAGELHDEMMLKGASLVVRTADDWLDGKIEARPQLEASSKKAPKIFREDCRIDWNQSAQTIHNHIRGLSPYPGAYTEMHAPRSLELKILASSLVNKSDKHPKMHVIREGKRLFVALKEGKLEILSVHPKGKKPMKAADFLNGLPFEPIELG